MVCGIYFGPRISSGEKKKLLENNGAKVSKSWGPWAGDIQDLEQRKEPVFRHLIMLSY